MNVFSEGEMRKAFKLYILKSYIMKSKNDDANSLLVELLVNQWR